MGGDRKGLGEFEHLVILGVLQVGDAAYGVPIRREIERRTGRTVIMGAVYAALGRLERKGFVRGWVEPPRPEPGGRRRKCFSVTPEGLEALHRSREMLARMSEGLGLDEGLDTP